MNTTTWGRAVTTLLTILLMAPALRADEAEDRAIEAITALGGSVGRSTGRKAAR